ncbi:hypothetical protein TNCV_1914461 [Trichonephila clavipes]|nr:hypothetical protein TNCV_1914461 [Trichonephila clavipes]
MCDLLNIGKRSEDDTGHHFKVNKVFPEIYHKNTWHVLFFPITEVEGSLVPETTVGGNYGMLARIAQFPKGYCV